MFRTRDGTLTLVHNIYIGGEAGPNSKATPGPLGIREILVYRFGPDRKSRREGSRVRVGGHMPGWQRLRLALG